MAQLQSVLVPSVTPAQVWANLSTDLQSHALRLLAPLACTYATQQTKLSRHEVTRVQPTRSNQDPPRTP